MVYTYGIEMYSSSSIDSPGCQVVQLQARHSFHSIPQHRRLLLQRCCNSRLRSTVIALMAGWLRSGFPVHGLGSYPNTHTHIFDIHIIYVYTYILHIYICIYTVCILGSRIPQLNIKQQGLWTLRRALWFYELVWDSHRRPKNQSTDATNI